MNSWANGTARRLRNAFDRGAGNDRDPSENHRRPGERRIAIACQGGGSHTAFSAGVLGYLVENLPERHRIVGLSGTSGGAVCATTAWYGLLSGRDPSALLDAVWEDLAATGSERLVNDWLVAGERIADSGVGVPSVSPYDAPLADRGRHRLRAAMNRRIAFEEFSALIEATDDPPRLAIGAAAVETGSSKLFENEEITADTVLASAAVPDLFEAVDIENRSYWDGLYGQNPPILDLAIGEGITPAQRPDELWVIQVNPRVYPNTPTDLTAIQQRSNEMAGNVSLNQQLRTLRRLNRWAAAGEVATREHTPTEIEIIERPRSPGTTSKLDRRAGLIRDLEHAGRKRAAAFLDERDPVDAPETGHRAV